MKLLQEITLRSLSTSISFVSHGWMSSFCVCTNLCFYKFKMPSTLAVQNE